MTWNSCFGLQRWSWKLDVKIFDYSPTKLSSSRYDMAEIQIQMRFSRAYLQLGSQARIQTPALPEKFVKIASGVRECMFDAQTSPCQLSEVLSARKLRLTFKRQCVGCSFCSTEGLFEHTVHPHYLSRNSSSMTVTEGDLYSTKLLRIRFCVV